MPYKVTAVGMVSSMFYYSPFDVSDLKRNFSTLFDLCKEDDDLYLSIALGNVDSIRMGIVSRAEKEDMGVYQTKIVREFGNGTFLDTAIKGGFCYYSALTGGNPGYLAATCRMLQWDFPRLIQVMIGLDNMGSKWGKESFFNALQSRVIYGVEAHLVDLVKLPDIGRVRAERLWNCGIKTLDDVVAKADLVRTALNMKPEKVEAIIRTAQGLLLTS